MFSKKATKEDVLVKPDLVVAMDLRDYEIKTDVLTYAKYFDLAERSYKFGESFSLISASRVIFIGHGGTHRFGEKYLKAEEFADILINDHQLPIETTIIIDLLGCSINDIHRGFRYIQLLSNTEDLPNPLLHGVCYLVNEQNSKTIFVIWESADGAMQKKVLSPDEIELLIKLKLPLDNNQVQPKILPRFSFDFGSFEGLLNELSEMCQYTTKHSYARDFARHLYDKNYINVIVNGSGNCVLNDEEKKKYALTASASIKKIDEYGNVSKTLDDEIYGILHEDCDEFIKEREKRSQGLPSNVEQFLKPIFIIKNTLNSFDRMKKFKITHEIIKTELLPEYRQIIIAKLTKRIDKLNTQIATPGSGLSSSLFKDKNEAKYKKMRLNELKECILAAEVSDIELHKMVENLLLDKRLGASTKIGASKTYGILVSIRKIIERHMEKAETDLSSKPVTDFWSK